MSKSLKVIITSGGTKVPIDDVRSITNFSKWTTWALIAEGLLQCGHEVVYVSPPEAKHPFTRELYIDPTNDFDAEVRRVKVIAETYHSLQENLQVIHISDYDEYYHTMQGLMSTTTPDVVIMSMAASDYGVEKQNGKIHSEGDISLTLHPLPKVIDAVDDVLKRHKSGVFLVGFKFLKDVTPDQLIDVAYKSMMRNNQNLCVANISLDADNSKFLTYIVTIEKWIIPVPNRNDLPRILLNEIEQRVSKNYFSTKPTIVEKLPIEQTELQSFISSTRGLANLGLFEPYLPWSSEEFGFVAKRIQGWTLITGRGSNKSNCTDKDCVLVEYSDLDSRTIKTISTDKKASLNAPVADYLFKLRPEINYIIHAHIDLPQAYHIPESTSPWTVEDVQSVFNAASAGHTIIHQPHHGVMILLHDLNELIPLLKQNNIYNAHAQDYDLAYLRFQINDSFIDIVENEVPKDAKILDMCAGSGEVSRQLQSRGYSNIDLADKSSQMLDEAKKKLADVDDRAFYLQTLEQEYPHIYDAIVIRQAINYVDSTDLFQVFSHIYEALNEGWVCIFNTFQSDESKVYLPKQYITENDIHRVITHEWNLKRNGKLYHGQISHIFNKTTGEYRHVYDLNSFSLHNSQEVKEVMEIAWFTVTMRQENNSLYFVGKKLD